MKKQILFTMILSGMFFSASAQDIDFRDKGNNENPSPFLTIVESIEYKKEVERKRQEKMKANKKKRKFHKRTNTVPLKDELLRD